MSVRSGGLCPFVVCLLMVCRGKGNSHLAARIGKLHEAVERQEAEIAQLKKERQKAGTTVRAGSFVLVDEAGETRVMLGVLKKVPKLFLFGRDGKVIFQAPR